MAGIGDGAGKFSVPGLLTTLTYSRARPTVLAVGQMGLIAYFLSLAYYIYFLPLSRKRLDID